MKTILNWGVSPIPSGAFSRILDEWENVFDSFLTHNSYSSLFRGSSYPVNSKLVKSPDGAITHSKIEFALAGVPKDSIKVTVEDGKNNEKYLTVSVKKQESKDEFVVKGTTSKAWESSYALTNACDVDNISVSLKDGLLSVLIPIKKEQKREPKELAIS